MQHLEDGIIQELIDGEIPSRDLAPLQQHLAGCEACRARLDAARMNATEADELLTVLDELPLDDAAAAPPPVVPRQRPHWSRDLAWAASLVLAAGLGFASRDVLMPRAPVPESRELGTPALGQAPGTGDLAGERAAQDAARVGTATEQTAPSTLAPRVGAEPPRTAPSEPTAASQPPLQQQAPPSAPLADATAAGAAAAPASGVARGRLGFAEQESAAGLRMERRAEAQAPATLRETDAANRAATLEMRDAAKSMVAAREVSLPTAMQTLGGSIKLIDGMVPTRLDAVGDEVLVVYRVVWGELLLSQRRVDDRLEWHLTGPPGFPADSLAVLRGKVRP